MRKKTKERKRTFPHDVNARNDKKIYAVRMDLGDRGYACYFMILEMLSDSDDYCLCKDYNKLGYDMRIGSDIIKRIVEDYGLFEFTDDGRFYSERLREYLLEDDRRYEKMSNGGKKGMMSRFCKDVTPLKTSLITPLSKTSNHLIDLVKNDNPLIENEQPPYNPLITPLCDKEKEDLIPPTPPLIEEKEKIDINAHAYETLFPKVEIVPKVKLRNVIPPTYEMVENYCKERNNGINAHEFVDFYTSKGWVVGKTKMKDWQAAVRTWESQSYGRNGSTQNTSGVHTQTTIQSCGDNSSAIGSSNKIIKRNYDEDMF